MEQTAKNPRNVNSVISDILRIFGIQPKFCIFFAIFKMHSLMLSFKTLALFRSNYEEKRNYLSSFYLFRALEMQTDNELTIIFNPLSVNFTIN